MTTREEDPAALVLAFLSALERGADRDELAAFLSPRMRQREFPSAVKPHLAERGLQEVLDAVDQGARLLSSQQYDVDEVLVSGDRVVLQLRWSATLARELGALARGDSRHAYVAMFSTVRDGLIEHQASYDCYLPLDRSATAP